MMKFSTVSVTKNPEKTVNTVCVSGSARGGTTMIAGMLRQMEVDMGIGSLDMETYEDVRYLDHQGHRDLFDDKQARHNYLSNISHLTDHHNSCGLSGWKDPLSSYYIPDIADDIDGLGIIFVNRDPVSTALGEIRYREQEGLGSTYEEFLGGLEFVNKEYMQMNSFLTGFSGKCIHVSYEKAILNPLQFTIDMAAFIAKNYTKAILDDLTHYVQPGVNSGSIGNTVAGT